MYCTDESKLVKTSGGQGESQNAKDWVGDWKSSYGTLSFSESGDKLVCHAVTSNFSDIPVEFSLNSDGTIQLVDTGYNGWFYTGGTADAPAYYYLYAYNGNDSVKISSGEVILKGTIAEDKGSITLTTGVPNATRILMYCGGVWGTKPQNWLATYNKVTE